MGVARAALGVPADKPIPLLTLAVERTGVPVIRRPTRADAEPATNIEKHLGYTAWGGRALAAADHYHARSAEAVADCFANELLAPKYEPGWKDRTPELPGLLRYWLERTVRTSHPKAVAALMGMWPADLLGQLLDEQALPGRQPAAPASRRRGHGR